MKKKLSPETEFKKHALVRGGILFFTYEKALEIINECEKRKIGINSIKILGENSYF